MAGQPSLLSQSFCYSFIITVAFCLVSIAIITGAYFYPLDNSNQLSQLRSQISDLKNDLDLLLGAFNITSSGVEVTNENFHTNNTSVSKLFIETLNNVLFLFGVPNGIATLDENGTLPIENIPPSNTPIIITSDNQTLTSEKWQSIFVFDTSDTELRNITLEEGIEGNVVVLSLLFKRGLSAHIRTLPYGTLLLTSTDSVKIITVHEGVWKVLNSEFDSFYPTEQQGEKLVGNTTNGDANQGSSVSLSADGNTLAVGCQSDNSGAGATLVFVRNSNNTWTQQGEKLVGTNGTSFAHQGWSVSLSADGNTLAVGAPLDNDDNFKGATWVFVRNSSNTWIQQGEKLVGNGVNIQSQQGSSVSLSADGNTLAVGGKNDDDFKGATWVFVRNSSNNVWTQQGEKLVGSNATENAQQGSSVSLSADGNTLAFGGTADETGVGATWVFIRTETEWTQQGEKLVGTGGIGFQSQGRSVSLSADGNTLAVGGNEDDNSAGATWVFTRSGTEWSQQGDKLVGTNSIEFQTQGESVSLSADGNTLAVGGPPIGAEGATWIFVRSGTQWTQQGEKLIGTNGTEISRQGFSVSLSADGNTLAVGGLEDNNDIGATWIFV